MNDLSPVAAVLTSFASAVARRTAAWDGTSPGTAATAQATLDALLADLDAGDVLDVAEARLADLAPRAGLDAAAARMLAAALLAEIHTGAHLLCGLLSGDDAAARPTLALVLELAGLDVVSARARRAVSPSAAAWRHGLLTDDGDGPRLSRRALVPPRVVAHLLGDDAPPPHLEPLLLPAAPVAVDAVDAVDAALRGGEPLVWIDSRHGHVGTALAAEACRRLDVQCLVADLGARDRGRPPGAVPTDLRPDVDGLLLEALLSGSVLVLAGADLAATAMTTLVESPVPVLAVGSGRWDARWAHRIPVCVVAPRLTTAQRAAEWRGALAGRRPAPEVTALRLTPEDIARAGAHARTVAALGSDPEQALRLGGPAPDDDVVLASVRRLGRGAATEAATTATLDDLVLPEHARDEVRRLITWGQRRDDVLALGPLQGKGGKGTGIAALFSGNPGTGKTLAAHVVADALGMELFQIDLSAIVDKYVGETEKNLEKVFAEAEALNCVLFIDEADALFGKRSAVSDANDRYANQEVAYLLQRMEAFDGLTVLATNLRGNLDPAFARRLHFMIHFPDPDAPTRERLWDHHLSQLPATDADDPVDVALLAQRLEIAGGDVRNIVLAAAYDAVGQGVQVGMRHLVTAAGRELTKLGRRLPSW